MPTPRPAALIRKTLRRLGFAHVRLVGGRALVHGSELYHYFEAEHLRKVFERFAVDCVFDVGANTGQHAVVLRRDVGFNGLIVSFEPLPAAAAQLRRRAADDPNWIVEELALSTADGEQELNIMRGSQFSSLSRPRHDESDRFANANDVVATAPVRTETLATAYARLHARHGFARPFLKLDTQGYDVRIVEAGRSVLGHFVGLQSELAVKRLYDDSSDFREALAVYEDCGFELSAFVPNSPSHFPRLIEVDCIMLRADLL